MNFPLLSLLTENAFVFLRRGSLRPFSRFACSAAILVLTALISSAQTNNAELENKLLRWTAAIEKWASSPEIVNAVLAQNSAGLTEETDSLQGSWVSLDSNASQLIPYRVNAAAKFLRKMRSSYIAEAFLNDATGHKVAFLEKPTNWCHAGKPKHEQPMAGRVWRGPIEVDASSGAKQIQISVPVLNEGKPIGSLVVGLNIFELLE